jgi:V-type H+-transporting ATPase subunit a
MQIIVIITIVLLVVLFVLEYLHSKSEGIMDAIDHIIALISNTLSFSRLIALLLVHAILSQIPFLVSNFPTHSESFLLASPLNWVIAIFLGLFLIVPLEGLLAFLNSLRLHWVEWFTKFYVGDGKPYTPIIEQLNYIEFIPNKGS